MNLPEKEKYEWVLVLNIALFIAFVAGGVLQGLLGILGHHCPIELSAVLETLHICVV